MTKSHTQKATELFTISPETIHPAVIVSLLQLKKAVSLAHLQLGLISPVKAQAIGQAVDEILESENLMDNFPISVFQTGSGTNTNMNTNEVIADLASKKCDQLVHPNDDVNIGQSSNDVFPSSIHLALITGIRTAVLPAVHEFYLQLLERSKQLETVMKTGRTHSMDAMPVSFGMEIRTWAQSLAETMEDLEESLDRLAVLPLGGTAVGTGINADPAYPAIACGFLGQWFDFDITAHETPSTRMGSQHVLQEVSQCVLNVGMVMHKIAQDLILLNSGPMCGMSDITLPAYLEGSSIMPGKVNPVIPEAVNQAYVRILGNTTTVQAGVSQSRLQLNVFLPVIGNALMENLELISGMARLLGQDIEGFEVNNEKIKASLKKNPIIITLLNSVIGYELGKKIVQRVRETGEDLVDVTVEMTDLSREEVEGKLFGEGELARCEKG